MRTSRSGRLVIRRLAAVDLHGRKGARLRRVLILVEFVGVPLEVAAIGIEVGRDLNWLGMLVIGVAVNFVPLAIHAVRFAARPGALRAELEGVDLDAELRHYTIVQLWVFVPLLFVVLAIVQAVRRRRRGDAVVPDGRESQESRHRHDRAAVADVQLRAE